MNLDMQLHFMFIYPLARTYFAVYLPSHDLLTDNISTRTYGICVLDA